MKFAGWYGVVVGLLMLGMWSFFLLTSQVPELQTEPYRISFHLAAEFTTAICLIIGGIYLIRNQPRAKPLYFIASGMVLYSLIVSPGYYAQQSQWGFVVMFIVLAALTIVSVVGLVHSKN